MNSLELLREKRIGVLCGGLSGEREVSLRSGRGVRAALQRQGFAAALIDPQPPLFEQLCSADCQVAFNALHGGFGEDGTLQAVLEYLGIPYTGSGVLACALTMNKLQTKRILQAVGLPTPEYVQVLRGQELAAATEQIVAALGLPVVLKPLSEGSSLGVTIPQTEAEVREQLSNLLGNYGQGLAERYIGGTEITVGIVGTGERLRALPVLELVSQKEFYDYEAKYTPGLTDLIVPARISGPAAKAAQETALRAHLALDCHGVSRVDMHLDEAGQTWIHELNSMPGMTETSDLPAAAAAEGTTYDELVLDILRSALARRDISGSAPDPLS